MPRFIEHPSAEAADTQLSPGAAVAFVRVEKYFLPLIFAFLAGLRFLYLQDQYMAWRSIQSFHGMLPFSPGPFFADITRNVLIFCLLTFTAVTLLLNRPPAVLPDKLKHVLVPLAGSYYVALYALIHYFPVWMRQSLLPDTWRLPAAMIGLGCSIVGYSIAIWAMVYLRRSFALFVSVRDVVTNGPYRLVRHPIYCGYLIDAAGLMLAGASVGMLILGAGHIFLLVYRARMEEQMLAGTDPAYRLYLARTGFLLPRL